MEITWRVIKGDWEGERGGKVQRISIIDDRWKIDRGRVRIVSVSYTHLTLPTN